MDLLQNSSIMIYGPLQFQVQEWITPTMLHVNMPQCYVTHYIQCLTEYYYFQF